MASLRALVVLLLIGGVANARAVAPDPINPRGVSRPGGGRPVPNDPIAAFRRQLMMAVAGAEASVQACADRFGVSDSEVDVLVTVGPFPTSVRVSPAGGTRFQRCATAAVRRAVQFASGRKIAMKVAHTYELDREVAGDDDGFAQPPPTPNPPCCKK